MSGSNSSNQNPFRGNIENELSPHVTFAAKSPSIIPTPLYDDSSSMLSSPYTLSSFLSYNQSQVVSSPLPITRQPDPATTTMPTVTEENDRDAFDGKVEISSNDNYGPTFREEDVAAQHVLSEDSLLTRGFVPPRVDQEAIQLRDFNRETPPPVMIPPPEQSRVDIFMNKLKGYQRPEDVRQAEEGGNQFRDSQQSHNILSRSIPKQRGIVFRQMFGNAVYPLFTWISAIVMIGVFVYELVKNYQLSGSVIQTSPFNPLIGPNYLALITMGSKFDPCMRTISKYPPSFSIGNCYTETSSCTIETACGFGGFSGGEPNQSFRFFTPIFLHAGVVHILLNLLSYFQTGVHIERTLGSIRFMILFLGSGIWGFILSATLSGTLSSSMGCSGALFGLLGYEVVELIINWKGVRNPCSQFLKLNIIIIISLAIGLLPGLDNFAHIGGFIMGLLLSGLLSPKHPSRSRKGVVLIWVVRIISLALIIALYVVFLNIFNTAADLDTVCPNCKYLSCLPVNGWCDV